MSTQQTIPERTTAQLATIPNLIGHLNGMRAPGSAPVDPDARRATTNPSRPTVRLEVVDLLDQRLTKTGSDEAGTRDLELDKQANGRRLGILGTLGLWVMMCRAEMIDQGATVERCCSDTDGHTVAGECTWLQQHHAWILDNHPDFAEDINWMHRDLMRATGERLPEKGYCPECTNLIEGQDQNTWFKCTGCGKTWVADAEIQRMFALQPPMSLTQISRVLAIPLRTLNNWWNEGRFMPVNRDPRFKVAMQAIRKDAPVFDIEHVKRAKTRAA